MNEIEELIKFYFDQIIELKVSRIKKKYKLNKIYFYLGFEILPFCGTFQLISNKICNFDEVYFLNQNIDQIGEKLSKIDFECKNTLNKHISTIKHPPTHIKATYDVELNITTFEYIYDKILDEENEDDFSSKMFYEWQYQLGKPRPVPINVPDGYHIEYRSTPINQYDKKGKLISIQTELKAVVVKDGE